MDDEQFARLTEPRCRRGEFPKVEDFGITNDAEAWAFHLHSVWCAEANQFKTPAAYAEHKLRRQDYREEPAYPPIDSEHPNKQYAQFTVKDEKTGIKSIKEFAVAVTPRKTPIVDDKGEPVFFTTKTKQRPETLQELIGNKQLFLLDDEAWEPVVELARLDGAVWYYVREWYIGEIEFDQPPKATSLALTPLVRDMVAGKKPKDRSKPPLVGYSDELLHKIAVDMSYRFGCGADDRECILALSEATGLGEVRIREKLADAYKGTAKKNYKAKYNKKK